MRHFALMSYDVQLCFTLETVKVSVGEHRSDAKVSDRCLIDVDLGVFAIEADDLIKLNLMCTKKKQN